MTSAKLLFSSIFLLLAGIIWVPTLQGQSATFIHKPTGMQFSGEASEQADFLSLSPSNRKNLYHIYDGPRKVIVPASDEITSVQRMVSPSVEVFELRQEVAEPDKSSIRSVGSVLQRGAFNEFGRRRIYVETNKGPVWLLEGITELAPSYARVQGIQMDGQNLFEFPFDYRIATTTIPGDLLIKMLQNATNDLSSYSQRLRIVQFLIQAERFRDALRELQRLLIDFPNLPQAERENADNIRGLLTTSAARLILDELEMRREAGQFQLVRTELNKFDPTDVTPETVTQADAQRRQLDTQLQAPESIKPKLEQEFADYLASVNLSPEMQEEVEQIRDEILQQLNPHNINRLATYTLRAGDAGSTPENRVSFIVSGWLLGAADAIANMEITLSMMEARRLLIAYLNSTSDAEREGLIDRLAAIEAGAVSYLAAMARQLLPWQSPGQPVQGTAGFYRFQLNELPGQPEFLVQLPPEYDPYKKYPCVVAVCDSGQDPIRQIEWWDNDIDPATGLRKGNASRHGYITIAPDWRQPLNYGYDYGPHAANVILKSLRKSMRMFAIDPDRVFLSGHGIGGEVAWDIGLSHPDLWAGVVPISAIADRYINFYKTNSKYNLPFYFVLGENHLPPARGLISNLDKREDVFKHMAKSNNYNFIVVVYRGRRSEHFYEEILNIFKWMRTQRRKFNLPQNRFEVAAMRPWDNFFWFYEMEDVPRVVLPPEWEIEGTEKGAVPISGEIKQSSSGSTNLQVEGGGNAATFWISPNWVNMEKEILIRWGGRKLSQSIQPDRRVLLEDLRRRTDVNNPFWAKARAEGGGWTVNDGR